VKGHRERSSAVSTASWLTQHAIETAELNFVAFIYRAKATVLMKCTRMVSRVRETAPGSVSKENIFMLAGGLSPSGRR
jgi:hypothetical protein